ncbi:DUF5634 family protein [Trichlorobacter lovleyi]|uniref:PilZ-like domain-containing protein n=1 Tax=Trichlorobacter lovleyi TaxID=313985 RepID=UPI00223F1C2B|nr:PilZ-like domain-containing protein [Trichlorobacter lovleyi]QOX78810.1 DUF5634 family protein [Trichlorobacter lovleyi]
MSDFDQYLEHFPVGLKVNVGIPVPGGDTFHDWAIIHSIDEDLVSLQLSRDTLPAGVKLLVGTILDIRTGNEVSGYSCRAIIVTEGFRREVLLRLIGEIVSSELREFYRIDAFLPIKYFISSEQSEVKLKVAWKEKREARLAAEMERRQQEKKPWERLRKAPHTEELPSEELGDEGNWEDSGEGLEQPDQGEDDSRDHSWDDVIPLAANISGGGVRMLLHHKFEEGTLVPLEIFLPSEPEPQIIDAVCVVAFANENYAASKQFNRTSYNTGLKFKFIEERERDAIVSYISNVQLKRIRQMREHYLFRSGPEAPQPDVTPEQRLKLLLKTILTVGIVIIALIGLTIYFKNYAENRPKNEIELIFEKGFSEYLKKIGRSPSQGQ